MANDNPPRPFPFFSLPETGRAFHRGRPADFLKEANMHRDVLKFDGRKEEVPYDPRRVRCDYCGGSGAVPEIVETEDGGAEMSGNETICHYCNGSGVT